MKIVLDSRAEERYNELAESLFREFEEVAPENLRGAKPRFEPDSFVAAHLTPENTLSINHLGLFDPYSAEASELVFHPKAGTKAFTLRGEGCARFEKLVGRISGAQPFSSLTTRQRVRSLAIEWFSERLEGTTTEMLVPYLAAAVEPTIKSFTAVVPIACLQLEKCLAFGDISLRPMNSTFFEPMERRNELVVDLAVRERLNTSQTEYRKARQGYAGAFVEVEGDPSYAKQQGLQRAARAVEF
ncbi:MAG: hypothetical protein K8J08_05235, partial [Thermoanaerobaculia bacterium]|nr:hypothetical protein [Thermoanaerobaculia bacterium]